MGGGPGADGSWGVVAIEWDIDYVQAWRTRQHLFGPRGARRQESRCTVILFQFPILQLFYELKPEVVVVLITSSTDTCRYGNDERRAIRKAQRVQGGYNISSYRCAAGGRQIIQSCTLTFGNNYAHGHPGIPALPPEFLLIVDAKTPSVRASLVGDETCGAYHCPLQ